MKFGSTHSGKKVATAGNAGTSILFALLFLPIIVLGGCHFQLGGDRSYQPLDEVTIPTGFTFAMNRVVEFKLTVMALDDTDTLVPYVGPVHVVNPAETGDENLGTGWTDAAGLADFTVTIPSSISTITLRPEQTSLDGLCLLSDFDQTLEAGTTLVVRTLAPFVGSGTSSASSSAARGAASSSRASTPVAFVDSGTGYLMLSTYDTTTGVPSGLETPRPYFSFKQSFKKNVSFTFPEGKKVPDSYINTGDLTNIILDAAAEISVTMASESSATKDAVGYFVRKKTTIPSSASEIAASDIVIMFPNASLYGSGGGLYQGDTIQLRNPDPTSANYRTTTFDKDMVVSWVLIPASFVGGKITTPGGRYYSIPALNPESGTSLQKAHVAQLLYNKPPYNKDKSFFLLGFEDSLRSTTEDGDYNDDFNDLMLTVDVSPVSAVNSSGLPEVKDETQVDDDDGDGVIDAFDEYPSDPARSSSVSYPSRTGYATAIYEDRWPGLGDYDFNDLAVDFRFTTVSNAAGKIVDLIGNFKIRAAGGELKSGLAFTLPVASSSITSVSYSTKQIDMALFKPGTNGVETTGSKSVVPVFSNAHLLFGVTGIEFVNTDPSIAVRAPVYLTVTTSFSQTSPVSSSVIAGSIPDLFLIGFLDLHGRTGMRKEIHTLDNIPTTLADSYPFGQLDDRSPTPPASGIYYKDKRGAPWALLLPSSIQYTVEKTQLATAYKYFSQWVYSGGVDYPDWYNYSKAGYADSSKLYLIEK